MVQPTLIRVPCPLCANQRTRYERTVRGFSLERCCSCGFVYVNPQYALEDLWKVYTDRDPDMLIELYSRLQTPSAIAAHDRILSDLEVMLGGPGRLLDFGCGPGYFFERAAERGWNAHGVEVGPWAQKAAELRGLRNLHMGPLDGERFPDASFDVVCANQVLEHLPTPKSELEQIHRVLRPGGVFYANVPNYRCLSIVLGRDDFELNMPPQHVNYFTPGTLRTLLERSGFQIMRTSTWGGLKWENLIGRRVSSEVADVYRNQAKPGSGSSSQSRPVLTQAKAPLAKRLVMPLIKLMCYRAAQVGLILEVFARKNEPPRPEPVQGIIPEKA
jgi:SAM-dependent methyltransferase